MLLARYSLRGAAVLLVLMGHVTAAWSQRSEPGLQPRFYRGREIAQTMHYTGAPG